MIKVVRPKAIIFDLDGTAMPNAQHVMPGPRMIAAVAAAQDSVMLCAATGRSLRNAQPILLALGLTSPCVIAAGTQIINPQTAEVLWDVTMSVDTTKQVLGICAPYDYEILVGGDLLGEGSSAASTNVDGPVHVLYIMACTQIDAEVLLPQLNQLDGITASGVLSWTQHGVDIHVTNSEATKEHAVTELLRLVNVDKADTVGVGDANNDVHLFQAVGYKIAMGNATDHLKSLADEVIDSVDNDGLAQYLELLLN